MHKNLQKIINAALVGSMVINTTPAFALEELDSLTQESSSTEDINSLNNITETLSTENSEEDVITASENPKSVTGTITVRYINVLTDKVIHENVIDNVSLNVPKSVEGSVGLPEKYVLDQDSPNSYIVRVTEENLNPVVEFKCYEENNSISMNFTDGSFLRPDSSGKVKIGVGSDEFEFSGDTIENIVNNNPGGFTISNSNILDYEKEVADLLEEESTKLISKRKVTIDETDNALTNSCKIRIKVSKDDFTVLNSAHVYRYDKNGKIYYLGAGNVINYDSGSFNDITFNSSKLGNFFITETKLTSDLITTENNENKPGTEEEATSGTITVKYVNIRTGKEIEAPEVMTDIEFGKNQYVPYKYISGYSLADETAHSTTVTLTKEEPSKEVIFYYNELERKYVANVTEDTYKENEDKSGIRFYLGGSRITLNKSTIEKMRKKSPTGFDLSISNILNNEKTVSDIIDNESVELLCKKRVEISAFNNSLIDEATLEFDIDEDIVKNNTEFHVYRIGDDNVIYYLGDATVDNAIPSSPELEFTAKDLGDFFITNGLLEDTDIEIDEVVDIVDDNDNDNENDSEDNDNIDGDDEETIGSGSPSTSGGVDDEGKTDGSNKTNKLPDTSGVGAAVLGASTMLTILGSSVAIKKKNK